MLTAVPATVPPSRLCTKFVPPIVFAREVLGIICICFVISMRPVLCLLKHTPKSKTYRAERPPFFVFEFWSTSEYPYSAKIPSKFVRFSVDFRCILGGPPLRDNFLRSKVAGGRPRRLRDDFVTIFDGFWPPFGEPRGSLWGSFGRQSLQMERLCRRFRCLFWCL